MLVGRTPTKAGAAHSAESSNRKQKGDLMTDHTPTVTYYPAWDEHQAVCSCGQALSFLPTESDALAEHARHVRGDSYDCGCSGSDPSYCPLHGD